MKRALEACSVFKCMNTQITGIPVENRAREVERICEEIMGEISQILEQSYGLCGRGRGWEDLGEWH